MTLPDDAADRTLRETEQQPAEEKEHLAWGRSLIVPRAEPQLEENEP